ncbi:D-amino acid dehydrogenase [Plastoroseomonas hellenica]|uniref:D-amino acid dehydrogenase n=1 Tax=Plastoroseomonas hellenica TaxID=2687306 RepID=UPI001BAB6BA5|nr:D-amino acid dehydrogenase [Plastoroseomonas hellenica]MBR0643291.1 D-amino acid dehydrogenase [Plastoroseomonas hellenica]
MRVVVLGSGVVGVASAWYLAKAGHEVTVLDRQPAPGMETSFANAGQVSFGYSSPWAAPGIPLKAMKWLMMRNRPLVVWPLLDTRLYGWVSRMLMNCTEAAYARNKARMVRVADYSRRTLAELREETGIEYDARRRGTLQLFRTQKQLDHIGDDTRVLEQFGVPYDVLDPAGCIDQEPALRHVKGLYVGGLRLPQDETGDAHVFTQRLAALAADKGVSFRQGVTIQGFETAGDAVTGIVTDQGRVTGDAFVCALGSFSTALLKTIGVRIPVYPVKGYSLTLPVRDEDGAPVSTVMDETFKVAITRLGDRIRVGGTAELASFSSRLREPRRQTLVRSLTDVFPRGGNPEEAKFWTGLRPMTPDGTPIVGATRYRNLHLNTGHGTLGWTMACGSGRLLADLVSGAAPEIDHSDLAVSRYMVATA